MKTVRIVGLAAAVAAAFLLSGCCSAHLPTTFRRSCVPGGCITAGDDHAHEAPAGVKQDAR